MDFSKVCGYRFRFCTVCQKETYHFRLEGEGCVAYVCRNYESHKEVYCDNAELVGEFNCLSKVRRSRKPD